MTRNQTNRLTYIAGDALSCGLSIVLFNIVRYYREGYNSAWGGLWFFLSNGTVFRVALLVWLFWMLLFAISGYYNQTLNKSRLDEIALTATSVFVGTVIEFLFLIVDDAVISTSLYLDLYLHLLGLVLVPVYATRLTITSHILRQNRDPRYWPKALLIGQGKELHDLLDKQKEMRYHAVGVIDIDTTNIPKTEVFHLGLHPQEILQHLLPIVDEEIKRSQPTEIYLALSTHYAFLMSPLLYRLYVYRCTLKITMSSSFTQGLRLQERVLTGVPLYDIAQTHMSEAEKNIKWLFDRLFSAVMLLILAPLYAFLAIAVRRSSNGPVFYTQERIGRHGKPFKIIKFRTMYIGAEQQGPQLSSEQDPRVTPIGKVLRKYRLDELPQFYNVLRGDMSLVGPRPERRYYIDQIVPHAPYYYLLHNVLPGITSWGMVRYGYASTVEEMVERLQYDRLYYENMSLKLDLTVLFYTIATIIKGKGK